MSERLDSAVERSTAESARVAIVEPERRVPVVAEFDVVVLGGGPAGIAAAIAAARDGAKTLLLERYGFLGGMGTAGGVTNFCGLHANVHGEIRQVVHGIADDILDRLRHAGGLNEPHSVLGRTAAQSYDNALLKCVADDALIAAGAEIRFHALAVGAAVEDRRITALIIETKSGRGAVRGTQFIDCSGDADLAYWVGAPTLKGDDDGFVAFPTLMFRMGHVDDERALKFGKPGLRRRIEEAQTAGRTDLPRRSAFINPQHHTGEWRANVTQIGIGGRPIDGTDWTSFSAGEIEGRRQVRAYLSFFRDEIEGFENAYLLDIAPQVGIRETRRLVGRATVSARDIEEARDCADAIGVNGWPIERHLKHEVDWRFPPGRGYHQIPFGAMVPQGIDNLLVAGRCASTTPEGQSSMRVTGPCFVMGEAAGTAAAMATKSGASLLDPPFESLQNKLEKHGVFLK